MRNGSLAVYSKEMEKLQTKKKLKIKEQNEFAKQLLKLVNQQQKASKRIIKNLEMAVAISTRPGYIEYASRSSEDEDVSDRYRDLIGGIEQVEKDLHEIEKEIQVLVEKKKHENETVTMLSSFEEWFSVNGRPKALQKGYLSEFRPIRKYLPHFGIGDDGNVIDEHTQQKRTSGISMIKGRLI